MQPLLPAGVEASCTSGPGRVIDFGGCSVQLLPYSKEVKQDPEAAWKPHIGTTVDFHPEPRQIWLRKLARPTRFEFENDEDEAPDDP